MGSEGPKRVKGLFNQRGGGGDEFGPYPTNLRIGLSGSKVGRVSSGLLSLLRLIVRDLCLSWGRLARGGLVMYTARTMMDTGHDKTDNSIHPRCLT